VFEAWTLLSQGSESAPVSGLYSRCRSIVDEVAANSPVVNSDCDGIRLAVIRLAVLKSWVVAQRLTVDGALSDRLNPRY